MFTGMSSSSVSTQNPHPTERYTPHIIGIKIAYIILPKLVKIKNNPIEIEQNIIIPNINLTNFNFPSCMLDITKQFVSALL